MMLRRLLLVVFAVAALAPRGAAQSHGWAPAKCDVKAGHFLVNSAILYLKNAAETKFPDQAQKDLKQANEVLVQAITAKNQDKNPGAWYYLGRYYVEMKDYAGADSAFTRAETLLPACKDDIAGWRRNGLWLAVLNAGVKQWQANQLDSAVVYLRLANTIYRGEPTSFTYLATIFATQEKLDSAAHYYDLAAQAASDPRFVKQKKEAMFNRAAVLFQGKRWADAKTALQAYLAAFPNDPKAAAALAGAYSELGQRDSALGIYNTIIAHADSADPLDVFEAGVKIFQAVPEPPDTAPAGGQCRTDARRNRTLTLARIRARCDSVTTKEMKAFEAGVADQYQLAARAFEAGLRRNPGYRDALFNLANTYYITKNADKMLPVATQLYAEDPLNRGTVRLIAGAWLLKQKSDSVLYYLQRADSLMPVEVTVSMFTPDSQSAAINGLITNFHNKPSAPLKLTFDFLDAKGAPVSSQTVDVRTIEAGGNYQFQAKAIGVGIVAWRYKIAS
ncbi:MAG TPA: tetratricopeptide repeat protein [Gemmatimonadales bacterium]|nr:tetratricopeptide repeat protein [Gemmatimonadales bacterium]